ncbi:hypothetical protein N332_04713, partial [Mesitornis unicolor]
SAVPPTSETPPGLWTATTAGLARGMMDLGTTPTPTGTPVASSPPTSDLYSSPGTVLSPTPVPTSTEPPAPTKDVPSLGTLAVASSL